MVSVACKYVPQPTAMTFAFSSVFILLLWPEPSSRVIMVLMFFKLLWILEDVKYLLKRKCQRTSRNVLRQRVESGGKLCQLIHCFDGTHRLWETMLDGDNHAAWWEPCWFDGNHAGWWESCWLMRNMLIDENHADWWEPCCLTRTMLVDGNNAAWWEPCCLMGTRLVWW